MRDGEGEAGVCELKVGGQSELDDMEERVSIDYM